MSIKFINIFSIWKKNKLSQLCVFFVQFEKFFKLFLVAKKRKKISRVKKTNISCQLSESTIKEYKYRENLNWKKRNKFVTSDYDDKKMNK